MAWIEVTEEHLLTKISGTELSSFRTAALATGQDDPVQQTIDQIVDEIRGYIAACEDNVLGEGRTIPEKLLNCALSLIIPELMMRAAGEVIDPNGFRRSNAEAARRLLQDVAACNFKIELPVEEEDEPQAQQKPSISGRSSEWSRELQDGL